MKTVLCPMCSVDWKHEVTRNKAECVWTLHVIEAIGPVSTNSHRFFASFIKHAEPEYDAVPSRPPPCTVGTRIGGVLSLGCSKSYASTSFTTLAQLIRPPLLTTHAFSLFSRVSNATIICISQAVRSLSRSTPECPPSETLAHIRQLSIHANHNEMSLRHARLLQESASQRG